MEDKKATYTTGISESRDDGRTDLLASIVDSCDDAIYAKTLDGIITSWNQAAELMYGYSAKEIIGKSVSTLVPTDRQQEMGNILEKIRSGERIHHFETLRRRKDGSLIHVSLSVSPIRDRDGRLIGASSSARDITERIRLEEQVRAASQYARSLIETTLDPMIMISLEGKITDLNDAASRVAGLPKDKLIGTDFSQYVTEPEKALEGFRQVLRLGNVTNYLLAVRSKDGKLTELLCNGSLYRDVQGNVAGVLAAGRDVAALKHAAQYARSLIEASPDALATISAEGKVMDVNEAAVKMTGVPRGQLIGTGYPDYFTEPDKAREGYLQTFSRGFVTDYPLTIRHKDGHLINVLCNASVYRDAEGKVAGVFAAVRDVTARLKAEARAMEQRASEERQRRELERMAELERFYKLTVGRELRMVELKKEIEDLRRENNALKNNFVKRKVA